MTGRYPPPPLVVGAKRAPSVSSVAVVGERAGLGGDRVRSVRLSISVERRGRGVMLGVSCGAEARRWLGVMPQPSLMSMAAPCLATALQNEKLSESSLTGVVTQQGQ